jgi:hypothetical protein
MVLVMGGIVLALAALGSSPISSRADDPPGPKVIQRDSVAYGRTYGEWSAAWWQWALSLPVASHPLFDNGDCSTGQSGPVWFLGGKFCQTGTKCDASAAKRSCSLPAGKALFFPVVNTEDSTLEESTLPGGNPNATIVDLRKFAESSIDGTADLRVEIDGVPVPNLKNRFRVQSSAFGFTLPDDNLFKAVEPGTYPQGTYFAAADDGVYVMLAPLPAGPHVLRFHGAFPAFGFTLDIKYNLSVK